MSGEGAPFPTCPSCSHSWHGLECRTSVWGYAATRPHRCGCPTSCVSPTPDGMGEFDAVTTLNPGAP